MLCLIPLTSQFCVRLAKPRESSEKSRHLKESFCKKNIIPQENKCVRKGCKLFTVNIPDIESEREQKIEDFLVLVEFKDVFPKEIPG